jgi:hypothetical protein
MLLLCAGAYVQRMAFHLGLSLQHPGCRAVDIVTGGGDLLIVRVLLC